MTIDASLLLTAAAAAAAGQQYPTAALYVVATPIGNLADITLRAIHVLSMVDAIACEDTRVSAGLLRHLGIEKPLHALHAHNEREASQAVLARLARDERVAYVSDAGTPAVSDPGAALVAAAQAAGYRCLPIPGASSALAALSVAGDTGGTGFAFVGFVGSRASERAQDVGRLAIDAATQVLFEAPHRIQALIVELAQACPQRRVTLCRELTKQFESIVTLPAADLPAWLAGDANRLRGEFVIVLHALEAHDDDRNALAEKALDVLLRDLPLKQAVSLAAEISGAPRNALYQRALDLRNAADG